LPKGIDDLGEVSIGRYHLRDADFIVRVGKGKILFRQVEDFSFHGLCLDTLFPDHRDRADPGHEKGIPGDKLGDLDPLDSLEKHLHRVI
jgi:hypothetical protein